MNKEQIGGKKSLRANICFPHIASGNVKHSSQKDGLASVGIPESWQKVFKSFVASEPFHSVSRNGSKRGMSTQDISHRLFSEAPSPSTFWIFTVSVSGDLINPCFLKA